MKTPAMAAKRQRKILVFSTETRDKLLIVGENTNNGAKKHTERHPSMQKAEKGRG